MCLIVLAWQVMPTAPLFVAANRDEFYDRPAAPADWWEDCPHVYAGRDLLAGGTWLGVTRDGESGSRFAAITNVRAPHLNKDDAPSRGNLVGDYLKSALTPAEYIERIRGESHLFNGFNLLVGDRESLIWFSNHGHDNPLNGQPLPPGVYGLSNSLLDVRWPKVVRTRAQFSSLLCQQAPEDAYFEMLSDTTPAPDVRLPDTGVSLEMERMLSSVCIKSSTYGTRVSTLVRIPARGSAVLHERLVR
jgi:uncharacterized protein with NRDE domain